MGKQKADAPNYEAAAIAEGERAREINEAQTWANRPDQVTPWGEVNWSNTPQWDPTTNQNINRWTQRETLNPLLQNALDSQMGLMMGRSQLGESMMGDLQNALGPGLDWSQFGSLTQVSPSTPVSTGGLPSMVGDLGTTNYAPEQLQRSLDYSGAFDVRNPEMTRQAVEESLYNRQAQRLGERFGGEREQMRIQLANQGLQPGDEAYDAAMRNLGQRETDAYQGAQAQAMQMGGQEASRMFGMEQALRNMQTGEADRMGDFYNQAALSQYGMGSSAQQQAFQDRLSAANFQNQARQMGLQERMGLDQYNLGNLYQFADYQNQLRQQAMNEALMQRGQRLNEVNALISGQQVGQPQFQPFIGANAPPPPQLLNAASLQGQQAAADASVNNSAAAGLMSGLTGLGIAGMTGGFFG